VFQLRVLVDNAPTTASVDIVVDQRQSSSFTQPMTIILLMIAGVLVSVAIALIIVCNRRNNDTIGKDDGDQQRVPTIVYETVTIVDQDKMNGDEQRWIGGGGKMRTVLFDTTSDVLDDSGYLEPPAIFESSSSTTATTTDLNRPPLAQHDYETSIMPIRETSL
jgi:hypothetical protein